MKRFLVLLGAASLLGLTGCDSIVKIQGAINAPATITSGTVSIVHLSVASDGGGGSVQVTVVTLVQPGAAQTTTFCGSQVNQFPMNTFVSATFRQGSSCANLVSVAKG